MSRAGSLIIVTLLLTLVDVLFLTRRAQRNHIYVVECDAQLALVRDEAVQGVGRDADDCGGSRTIQEDRQHREGVGNGNTAEIETPADARG